MKSQIIVTIGREFASGGHDIAEIIAQKLGIEIYDKEILQKVIEHHGFTYDEIHKYDEKPRNFFLSRRVKNHSNSIEEVMTEKLFDFLQEKADSGESFVVVGRCSDYILKEYPNALRVFILGDKETKTQRIMDVLGVTKRKAHIMMKKMDKKRKIYHNHYSSVKWGDSRGYHLSINSSVLGVEGTAEMILEMVEKFKNI